MKKHSKKLQLNRETLQILTLWSGRIVGGLESDAPGCDLQQVEPTAGCNTGSVSANGCPTTQWSIPRTFGC